MYLLIHVQGVNRMLLHWLKQWDHVVFGKDLPLVKDKQKVKVKDTGNNKWKKFQPEVSSELDEFKRPVQKVLYQYPFEKKKGGGGDHEEKIL